LKRTIIVGDVHGCIDELDALLDEVQLRPGVDRLILAGDLVAKGPDSRAVVRRAIELSAEAVKGNHDEKVLSFRRGEEPTLKPTHQQVVDSLGEKEWRYLEAMPLWVRLPGMIVVHAGLVPGRPLEEQREEDLISMRSLTPAGEASRRIEGFAPWASAWKGPELVVFGHDAVRGLQRHPFAIGLDSGCCYGRALTALVLPHRELVSVPARRAYLPVEKKG
jgi:diadenosine tetraphosphatase ApaH/serine/threonine PP2A family protein phosphatase